MNYHVFDGNQVHLWNMQSSKDFHHRIGSSFTQSHECIISLKEDLTFDSNTIGKVEDGHFYVKSGNKDIKLEWKKASNGPGYFHTTIDSFECAKRDSSSNTIIKKQVAPQDLTNGGSAGLPAN